MIEGRIITVGKKIVRIGWRCLKCSLETGDPKAPAICPHCYRRMEPITAEHEEKVAI